jgi:hypothetical protein
MKNAQRLTTLGTFYFFHIYPQILNLNTHNNIAEPENIPIPIGPLRKISREILSRKLELISGAIGANSVWLINPMRLNIAKKHNNKANIVTTNLTCFLRAFSCLNLASLSFSKLFA